MHPQFWLTSCSKCPVKSKPCKPPFKQGLCGFICFPDWDYVYCFLASLRRVVGRTLNDLYFRYFWPELLAKLRRRTTGLFLTLACSVHPIEYNPGACFSKVPKLFGPISGATILFISSQRRGSKPSNLYPLVFSYNKNLLNCYIPRLSLRKTSSVIGWFLVTCPWSNSNISRPGYNCAVVVPACRIQPHLISV